MMARRVHLSILAALLLATFFVESSHARERVSRVEVEQLSF